MLYSNITKAFITNLFKKMQKKEPNIKMIVVVSREGFPIASTMESENLEYTFSAFIASIHNVATKALWVLSDLSDLESVIIQGSDSNFIFKSDHESSSNMVIIVGAGKEVQLGFLEILGSQVLSACKEKLDKKETE